MNERVESFRINSIIPLPNEPKESQTRETNHLSNNIDDRKWHDRTEVRSNTKDSSDALPCCPFNVKT